MRIKSQQLVTFSILILGTATTSVLAQTVSLSVPAVDNLYYYTGEVPTAGGQPPVAVPLAIAAGQPVTVTASGCAITYFQNCWGPDGDASLTPVIVNLPDESLIGRWSTDPNVLGSGTAVGGSFFVGSSLTVNAPSGGGPYYLFLGVNDNYFYDNSGAFSVTASSQGIRPPTNVQANQIGSNGDQIQITWDYADDPASPIDGFTIERMAPDGNWVEVQSTPMSVPTGHFFLVDTGLSFPPYSTYSYRVRAYKGNVESDNSTIATCFQINKYTPLDEEQNVCLSCALKASFTPALVEGPQSLDFVSNLFKYDHFDWISMIDVDPYPPIDPSQPTKQLHVPYIDPPPGGYIGQRTTDQLPYYWDEVENLDPQYYYLTPTNTNGTSLFFEDVPMEKLLQPGQYIGFSTYLVGIPGHNGHTFDALGVFQWQTNYNGSIGGVSFRSILDLPTVQGTGGLFNITNSSLDQEPLANRLLLIQAGAGGVSAAPPLVTTPPMTAKFLSGKIGKNGWYSGPVTLTLIATDLAGPSAISKTTYSINSGSTLDYQAPLLISGDGRYTVQFGSVDKDGNVETPQPTSSFKIDTTPPNITGMPTSGCVIRAPNDNFVEVGLASSSDALSGVASFDLSVTSNKPFDSKDPDDIKIIGSGLGPRRILLRANLACDFYECKEKVYTLTASAADLAGNSVTSVATCIVTNPAAPIFSPAGGIFTSAQKISMSDASAGAIIHFTTDGSIPTANSATYNSKPVQVNTTQTLRAIAILNGLSSPVTSATYTINAGTCQTIDYSKGFTSLGLSLNGGATVTDNLLQLTDKKSGEARSAFSEVKVPIDDFVTDIQLQLVDPLADGITFTIQSNSPKAIGQGGGGLGYAGIPNSVAMKLDLHNNRGEGVNSTGMYIDGAFPGTPSIDLTPAGIDLHSGHVFSVHLAHANGVTNGSIKDMATGRVGSMAFPGDITRIVGHDAYVGFTGGTGRLSATQNILAWSFSGGGGCSVK